MRVSARFALMVFTISLPGLVKAQDQITKTSANPYARQLTVHMQSGINVVADKSTQTIYITNSKGEAYEVSFSDAVASLEPGPAKRAALLSEFESSLSDSSHVMTLISPRVATDTSYWPRTRTGNSPYPTMPAILANKGKASTQSLMGGDDFGGPCDLGPCAPNVFLPGVTNFWSYTSQGGGWAANQGGGSLSYQQYLTDDKARFELTKEDACHDRTVSAIETFSTGAVPWELARR